MPPRKPAIFVTTAKHVAFAHFIQRLKDRKVEGSKYRAAVAMWRINHSEASN